MPPGDADAVASDHTTGLNPWPGWWKSQVLSTAPYVCPCLWLGHRLGNQVNEANRGKTTSFLLLSYSKKPEEAEPRPVCSTEPTFTISTSETPRISPSAMSGWLGQTRFSSRDEILAQLNSFLFSPSLVPASVVNVLKSHLYTQSEEIDSWVYCNLTWKLAFLHQWCMVQSTTLRFVFYTVFTSMLLSLNIYLINTGSAIY